MGPLFLCVLNIQNKNNIMANYINTGLTKLARALVRWDPKWLTSWVEVWRTAKALEAHVVGAKHINRITKDNQIARRTILDTCLRYHLTTTPFAKSVSDAFDLKYYLSLNNKTIDYIDQVQAIIGVQPMTGPVSLVYNLAYAMDDGAMKLRVDKNAVEAKTTPLVTCPVEQLESLPNSNVMEDWAMQMTAIQSGHAIITNVLNIIRSTVDEITPISMSATAEEVLINIHRLSNDIAHKTKRGAGNVVVMNQPTFTRLVSFGRRDLFDTLDNVIIDGVTFVGTTAGKAIQLYVSNLLPPDVDALIAYKGGNGDTDSGVIYTPYIPIVTNGVHIDADTFQPQVRLSTRSGCWVSPNVGDYYRAIKLTFE